MSPQEYDNLPKDVKKIVDSFDEDKDNYLECKRIRSELKKLNWDCQYGLDGVIYDVKDMKPAQHVSFELAEALKSAGFAMGSNKYYKKDHQTGAITTHEGFMGNGPIYEGDRSGEKYTMYEAPSYDNLQDWLIKVEITYVTVDASIPKDGKKPESISWSYRVAYDGGAKFKIAVPYRSENFPTKYEAFEGGFKKLFELNLL